jgi:hypothetical protein
VSPVKYDLGFYIPDDDILHSHCRENLKSYIALTGWALQWRCNVSPVILKGRKKGRREREVGGSERHYGWGEQNLSAVLKVPRH